MVSFEKFLSIIKEESYHFDKMGEDVSKKIQSVLSQDMLKHEYKAKLKNTDHFTCGHCFAATDAAYHLYGKDRGFKPKVLGNKEFPEGLEKGETHWYLMRDDGSIIDPTKEQFGNLEIPYDRGKGNGYISKEKATTRGRLIMDLVLDKYK